MMIMSYPGYEEDQALIARVKAHFPVAELHGFSEPSCAEIRRTSFPYFRGDAGTCRLCAGDIDTFDFVNIYALYSYERGVAHTNCYLRMSEIFWGTLLSFLVFDLEDEWGIN
jgi:hypothetical protein